MSCAIRGCGTYRGYLNGCRCIQTRAAWANYKAEGIRGMHRRYPAEPVRIAIDRLHQTMTYDAIARATGLDVSGIKRIAYGEYSTVERRTRNALARFPIADLVRAGFAVRLAGECIVVGRSHRSPYAGCYVMLASILAAPDPVAHVMKQVRP